MIKLLNILQEIVVAPNLLYQKILDYIQNGSQGDLNLRKVDIKRLPKSLKVVRGSLHLEYTPIQSLPDNLTVTGNLFLNGTPIQSLPDNLTVGDNLHLEYTPIQSLPDNLTVGGNLNLEYSSIESLPDNLTVEGSLFLRNTPLSEKYTTKEQLKAEYPNIKVKGFIFL